MPVTLPYWQPDGEKNGDSSAKALNGSRPRPFYRGRRKKMTYGALAMFAGAILFPRRGDIGESIADETESRIDAIRANGARRTPLPGNPQMVEDDYYRFLNAPRG